MNFIQNQAILAYSLEKSTHKFRMTIFNFKMNIPEIDDGPSGGLNNNV